ncbi:hypothetical protein LRP50_06445 [Enterovibrio sp. ZSDZ42]|uniref:Uncharacterized protein n=1 Tax=Enterovibrio gelatinilyticus TaxID=2899819 RepID=A0ABT5QXN9_9GAMM|nr:hypothetical protein [Enterovibrio sp. ZSDZ42]MDD1792759.1 hypothetical protein [Enterovibrio sp. ZSDZ42]
MKTIIGISNFSFDFQNFNDFLQLKNQFEKIKSLQGQFEQHGTSLSIATDILKNKYFGLSLEEQFNNFSFGKDKQNIIAFRSQLERNYLRGFDKKYTSKELLQLAAKPDEVSALCCTIYAPKVLISGYSSFKTITDFSLFYEDILGKFPINNENYYSRATSHFKNILYHEDCSSTLNRVPDGFCNYSIAITQCLRALNALSPVSGNNINSHLADIATKARYACTPEGYSHENFKFNFNHNGNNYPKLGCQYHLKPSERNLKGDGSHNHKRIYFGFFPIGGDKFRIAVAAIGPHITIQNSKDRYAPIKTKRKKIKRRGNS